MNLAEIGSHGPKTGYLLLLVLFLQACSGDDEAPANAFVAAVSFDGDVSVSVQLSPELEQGIEVVGVQSHKPGPRNAIDVLVQLRNLGPESWRLRADGAWLDERGNRLGGQSNVLQVAANAIATVQAGTNSMTATRYRLNLSPTMKTVAEISADALANPAQQIAEGYGMTFSATAGDEVIPALPIRGSANGQPFVAGTVVFRESHTGTWHLEISDHEFDPLGGPALARSEKSDVQTIYLNLPEAPAAGARFVRDMEYGGGYFQIKPAPDSDGTTSWNTSTAWQINIEKWEKGDTVRNTCGQPDIGSASGTLYISFQGTGMGIRDSWVSGQFTAAPILYCGTP